MQQPLGDRALIDTADGQAVAVTQPGIDDKLEWPYDQQRVSEAEYEAALAADGGMPEQRDPDMTAWVRQDLNFKTFGWSKPIDAQGNMSAEALTGVRTGTPEALTVVNRYTVSGVGFAYANGTTCGDDARRDTTCAGLVPDSARDSGGHVAGGHQPDRMWS